MEVVEDFYLEDEDQVRLRVWLCRKVGSKGSSTVLKYGQGTVLQGTRNMARANFNSQLTVAWSQYQSDLTRSEVHGSASKT